MDFWCSLYNGRVDIPSDLTDNHKAWVFQYLDANLNSAILHALIHGIYTGITAVTLWNIYINQCWQIRRALVVVIILLYSLTTIDFAANWTWMHFAFIQNGKSFWTAFLKFYNETQAMLVVEGITSSISTIIADLYIIWCCWIVWGQCWITVLLPILFLIAATASIARVHSRSQTLLPLIKHPMKGVAPTLLIGRAAAGHTQPNNDDDSTTSSEASTTSYQELIVESSVYEVDIEAQQEQGVALIEVVERTE
ncbi:hypothetical protein IW261DRAFT_1426629 [Armillaria novae-zelandiae]|uniref:Uncharacterized protein n=1 Tax=Armillaria novae-zelandiae TaxID=153914 RepID=A0AA39U5G8_9AGAR|nr:hypothetical protein IW261DRAFT_1426629 [Armillaria novae-zelandiae]